MLVLSGRHFRRQFRTGPAAGHGRAHFQRSGVPKRPENTGKSDPQIFFGVVYTHFDAFRAAIQKMKKKMHRAPLGGDLCLGTWRFSDLAIFRGRGCQNGRKIRENPGKSDPPKKFGLYILMLTHFAPLFKK